MQKAMITIVLSALITACGGSDDSSASGGGGAGVERFAGRYLGTMGVAGDVISVSYEIDTRGRINPMGLIPGCEYTRLTGYQVNNKGRFNFHVEYSCFGGRFAGCSRLGISAKGKINNSGLLTANGNIRGVCSGQNVNSNRSTEIRAQRQ